MNWKLGARTIAGSMVAGLLLVAAFQNCTGATVPSAAADTSQAASTAVLAVMPAAIDLAAGSSTVFVASGGGGSYTFTAYDDCGSVTEAGVYTAPTYQTICTLMVTDASGSEVNATITVSASVADSTSTDPLAASYTVTVSGSSETVSFVATGGSGVYSYSVVSGSGSLSGATYTTSASGESAVVEINDGASVVDVTVAIASLVSSTQPVYRSLNLQFFDHLLSLSASEGPGAGYTSEGTAFSTFVAASATSVPLYRCLLSRGRVFQHFTSTSSSCEGANFEGTYGFIESVATTAAPHALYRCTYAGTDSLTTTSSYECAFAGFSITALLGYVP